jgi:hypothetical protein
MLIVALHDRVMWSLTERMRKDVKETDKSRTFNPRLISCCSSCHMVQGIRIQHVTEVLRHSQEGKGT